MLKTSVAPLVLVFIWLRVLYTPYTFRLSGAFPVSCILSRVIGHREIINFHSYLQGV